MKKVYHKRDYQTPTITFTPNLGGLSHEEIAGLSDTQLEDYLRQSQDQKNSTKYQANANFLLRDIGGESVLIPVGEAGILENSILSLNETCQYLWNLFQTPMSIQEAVSRAQTCYSDPDGRMEQEIAEFVEAYLQIGLLQEE